MRNEELLLADIGNTHFHISNGKKVEHLTYVDAMKKYREKELLYITVKHQLTKQIEEIENWKNISSLIKIEGEYFYELLPGFILAFIAIIVVSLMTAKPSEETLQKFDESQL